MFADALLDSQNLGNSRRGWATLTSFGIQAALVACLLIVPLLYTQGLPHWKASTPVALPPLGDTPIAANPNTHPSGGATSVFPRLQPQPRILPVLPSNGVSVSVENTPPDIPFGSGGNGSHNPGSPEGIWNGAGDPTAHVVMPRHAEITPRPHMSVMMEGHLIHRVDPTYPQIARTARVEGSVVIAAVIGTDGSVQKLQVLSGNPLLVPAARDAVAQWRYRPYILNGSPIEVDTQVTVNFILSR